MPLTKERYRAAVAAIDAANAEDPNTLVGSSEPLALAQGVAATRWTRRLAIHPSDGVVARRPALTIFDAGTVPRATYPEGRTGYLKWRVPIARMLTLGTRPRFWIRPAMRRPRLTGSVPSSRSAA